MFNWFNKKEKIENPIKISVNGINPQTDNEFLFYNFIEFEFTPHLKKWYELAKQKGIEFKPQYENAIKQKIKTGEFDNPHNFSEYFNNKFDYIAIDFETANKNRVSACALGIVFIKNDKIAYETSHFIKPPKKEKFSNFHSNLHGICQEDVEYSDTFDELWECDLSKYFNHNLIVLHNASMDLGVLKNLFEHYSIQGYKIEYLDTMKLAEKVGKPKKLRELAEQFEIEFENLHDPKEDARVCAYVFGELAEIYPNYKELYGKLNFGQVKEKVKRKQENLEVKNENLDYIHTYSISKEQVNQIEINENGFIFTGEITTERSIAKKMITENGGLIKSGITSKVDYVIVGTDFGWSKIQKIHELNSNKGCRIKILTNSDFENLKIKYAT